MRKNNLPEWLVYGVYLPIKKWFSGKMMFFLLGIGSTIWFLIRVIPKPSRAGYPCMRAAAPFMSAFILYILSLSAIVVGIRNSKRNILKSNYAKASLFAFLAIISIGVYSSVNFNLLFAETGNTAALPDGPNTPMGTGQGIKPGRVVWAWDPSATNENQTGTGRSCYYVSELDNYYYLLKNNNQTVINRMMSNAILTTADDANEEIAWTKLFKHFNNKKAKGDVGYNSNEIVFIKINMGGMGIYNSVGIYANNTQGCWGSHNKDLEAIKFQNVLNTTPQTVMALIKSLVEKGKVPQENIYVGDPMKNVYKIYSDYWLAAYPNIKILGNRLKNTDLTDFSILKRTPVAFGSNDQIFYSDKGKQMDGAVSDKFYTIIEDADYMINLAALKSHACAGVTLCAKNHFGSHTRDGATHLHKGLLSDANDGQTRVVYDTYYRVQVDLMGHKLLGGNTLLYIVDGLYASKEGFDETPVLKFKMAPFNNDFPSSIFMSQDAVAIESVCYDFLRTESALSSWSPNRANYGAVDDYLHQAADKANWPKTVGGSTFAGYDPENDGSFISSLGTHEHWNNATSKQYSKNLDPTNGKGIELVFLDKPTDIVAQSAATKPSVSIFPLPANANTLIEVSIPDDASISIEFLNMEGKIADNTIRGNQSKGVSTYNLPNLKKGFYVCKTNIIINDIKITLLNKIIFE